MKWNKLVKVDGKRGGNTRIISIRAKLLEEPRRRRVQDFLGMFSGIKNVSEL